MRQWLARWWPPLLRHEVLKLTLTNAALRRKLRKTEETLAQLTYQVAIINDRKDGPNAL